MLKLSSEDEQALQGVEWGSACESWRARLHSGESTESVGGDIMQSLESAKPSADVLAGMLLGLLLHA